VFRSILAAIDGSAHASRALDEAADLARATGATLTVLTSVPDLATWTSIGAGYAGVSLQSLVDQTEKECRTLLDDAAQRVGDGVEVAKVLAHGPAGPAIVDQVGAGGHDLVVMGSRGRGDVAALLLGSVSHHVVHAAPVAVLIVHAQRSD
jgi:nucleotide-binding universal stress UspA family protein